VNGNVLDVINNSQNSNGDLYISTYTADTEALIKLGNKTMMWSITRTTLKRTKLSLRAKPRYTKEGFALLEACS
jgi:hypothetical protein